ncbi:MAG: hypothetical protein QXH03_02650 [Candidatus Bathyarchaeia archaeon]
MRKLLVGALIASAIISVVYAIAYYCTIQHIGVIQAIGCKVYAEDAQNILTELNWGDIYVGYTYQRFGYLKSTSSVNATVQYALADCPSYLDFNLYYQTGCWNNSVWTPTSDWIDMAESPYLIQPNEWLRLKFQLAVAENATVGPFSFTIIISVTAG